MTILTLFTALLAVQTPPPMLKPAGSWELEEHEAGCRAVRRDAGGTAVTVGFETWLTGSNTTMFVTAPKALLPDGRGKIALRWSPAGSAETGYGAFEVADPKLRLVKLFPTRELIWNLASAETVKIGPSLDLSTEGFGAAQTALEGCTSDLLTGWGADPALWRDGKLAGLAGSPQNWFRPEDGRAILPRGVASGKAVLLVTTTPEGAPGTCKAVNTTDPRIGDPACAIAMKRATFRAPLGADGKPMASYAVVPVSLTR
ncbi:hypothetical protein P1X14_02645 [Sphingomonas sp. AOB5]|uniref:hypothetical protein n=1 Tax=Sphingomonas sp. AOB5 TaxID=3034017 RepID=UPI0023F906E0|nr:hypothetical protein [Sphingomonas sp. AOB5]MDF7774134.1 hypothetical protein [Sphingomonas sp. AOB5]